MAQNTYTRGPVQPLPAWPLKPDARYDPVVFDTELDSLASFQPEHVTTVANAEAPRAAARAPSRPRYGLPRLRTPRLLVAAGLALLVIVQAATIAFLLGRGVPGREVAPVAPAGPVASPTGTPGTSGSATVADVASKSSADTAPAAARAAAIVSSNGRLQVRSTPPGATVLIDGRRRGIAPLTVDGISPGTHRVQVVNGSSSIDQSVTVEPGSLTSLLIPISQSEGWVDVSAPVVLQVLEGGQLLGTSADPLQLKPGAHSLELRNDSLGYVAQSQVSVKSGELLTLKPVLPDGLLQVNAVPWAHVWVDGRPVGDTPLGTLKASLGPHEIRFQHPERGEQVRQVVVSALAPARVSVDFR